MLDRFLRQWPESGFWVQRPPLSGLCVGVKTFWFLLYGAAWITGEKHLTTVAWGLWGVAYGGVVRVPRPERTLTPPSL